MARLLGNASRFLSGALQTSVQTEKNCVPLLAREKQKIEFRIRPWYVIELLLVRLRLLHPLSPPERAALTRLECVFRRKTGEECEPEN